MKRMNIVGVISSANSNGNSATLLHEALRGAKEAGADVSDIVLTKYNFGFCKGCMRCMREGKCFQMDDFESIRKMLIKADGIILSSPTYAAAPSALLKNLIDRLGLFEYMTASTFGGKYFAAISTAKSFGAKDVVQYLKKVASGGVFGKAYVSGTLGVILRSGKTASEVPEYMRKASALGEKMVSDFLHRKTFPLQNFFTKTINNVIVKPLIAKSVGQYKDAELHGVYENLKERGLIA